MNKRYTANVEEDENGAFIVFPEEMMSEVGWKEGDNIKWTDNGDGSYTLSKVKKPVLVMVECVSLFRMRYLVEAPADHPEYALDTVAMNEAKEFSQLHISEDIVSHRIVTEEEALAICDVDNDYLKTWTNEQKLNTFVTTMDDQGYKDEPEDEVQHSGFYYDTERNK